MTHEKNHKTSYYKEVRFVALIGIILSLVFIFAGLNTFALFSTLVSVVFLLLLWVMPDRLKYYQDTCHLEEWWDDIWVTEVTSCCKQSVSNNDTHCRKCGAEIIEKEKK